MRGVAKAAVSGLNLGVAGTAALGAVALHSWSIAALGAVAYATLLAWDLASGKDGSKKQRASVLPDPKNMKDAGVRSAMQTLANARTQLDRVLGETSEEVKMHLTTVLSTVDELELRAAKLAGRAETIGGYLLTTDVNAVEEGVRQLGQRIAETRDVEARAQYESAKRAREEHHATLLELTQVKERIFASLVTICATMDALPAKVVRMRALDAAAMDALTGSLNEELSLMNDDMKSLEETLKSVAEVTL